MPLLDWLNKSQALKAAASAPFRLLDEVPELSYGDEASDNMIIQGDNLDGLKALLPLYAGKVKCVSVDPPYNTRHAFTHYDDNLEHSVWLSLIYPRIELLRELLSEDGTIWINIDDDECHYLKVICDEIFGRSNFVANVIWQKKFSPQNDAKWMSDMHDHILVYAKNKNIWHPNKIPIVSKTGGKRKNIDNDPRGEWVSVDYTCNKNKTERPNLFYSIKNPNTEETIWPKETAVWRFSKERHLENVENNLVYWGKEGRNRVPRYKNFSAINNEGQIPTTVWLHQDVGNNQEAKKESLLFNETDPFATPKPERLLQRIFQIATNENDLVLDSFLGSGTTAAVAHKMNRRYIGIELGDHAQTHCAVRLKKVIDGEQGGISEAVNWKGGGGFRFYKLGAEIFLPNGNINPDVKFKQLASFVWFAETKRSLRRVARNPLLGIHEETAYYLLYNGILGDHRPNGGNVLTRSILKELPAHDGPKVIYGDSSLLGVDTLKKNKIVFKQIPYEVRTR
jgi:adenine-specific DNA-methyltransferase